MTKSLFGNYGIRNSVQNGQTQKTLQIASLLDRIAVSAIQRIDTTNLPAFSLKYVQTFIAGDDLNLCLGQKGLAYAALLHSVLSSAFGRRRANVVIFVVGGWLKDLVERNRHVRQLCSGARVLVETSGLRAELESVGIAADVFPNFRDLPIAAARSAVDMSQLRLLFAGRISKDKGFREAIALADAMHDRGHAARLTFLGPILDDDFLGEVGRRGYVVYGGAYNDPRQGYELMLEHDFIILPSRYAGECVPGALVEAKFAGLPAVVSNWRFLPEVVGDKHTGFVCALSDFAQEAADKVIALGERNYLAMSKACGSEARGIYNVPAAEARLRALLSKR